MATVIVLTTSIYLAYWTFIFSKMSRVQTRIEDTLYEDVSIVVCVKNGADHLPYLLPKLLDQGALEVIIVDDYSTDRTKDIIRSHEEIIYLHASHDRPGKKTALFDGIRAAQGRYILLTDVDCSMDKSWLKGMRSTAGEHSIVLGYSPMLKQHGLIALFSRYETFHTAIQYFGYHLCGITYMGVGRNMLVLREAALEAQDYVLSSSMASGDDDLLVNYLAQNHPVGVNIHKDTFVYTQPQSTVGNFIRQKSRHITTSQTYSPLQKIMLGTYSITHMATYTLGLAGVLFGSITWQFFLSCLLIKWLIQMVVGKLLSHKLEEENLWIYIPIMDIIMFMYLVVLTPYIFVKNNTRWK